jgi:hypothetical protein
MSLSLYDVSIPVFIRTLENMSKFLEKGRAFADERDMLHTVLLEARLYEDMAPLTSQVQRASDAAKITAARMGQLDAPKMEDNETSFDELQARIAATIAFLKTVPVDAMDDREDAEIILPTPGRSITFRGKAYVLEFAIPNFFFHVTTAYALLRMMGVPVGKLDYLGGI